MKQTNEEMDREYLEYELSLLVEKTLRMEQDLELVANYEQ